ncbi:MAG: cupin domain-containing protein [Clostridiales bacterium]|nr:cupin domain-containing protein [Clostridiales bacterium]
MKGMSLLNYPYYPYSREPQHRCPDWNDRHRVSPSYPDWDDRHRKPPSCPGKHIPLKDYGPEPFVVDMEGVTFQNENYRTALWTGKYLQLTLMTIPVDGEIGLELHNDVDQFLRVEQGKGLVVIGDCEEDLNYERVVYEDCAILVPAGKWHNLINAGYEPLKVYSIYAPPEHPHGTVHRTKEESDEAHGHMNKTKEEVNKAPKQISKTKA